MRKLAVTLVVAFIASACGGTAAPSPSPSVGATQAAASPTIAKATCQPTSVKIAVPVTPPNVVHLPPYVAQELGYFKDENLTVELVRFEGGVGALKAMVAGGVNLAGTSTEPVVNAISQGVEVKVVGSYAPNVSQVFAVRGDIIKASADLKGKRIGIQEAGAFADALSRAYLNKVGIDAKDVQFVRTTTAGRVEELRNPQGSVDTAILHVDQVLTVKKTSPNVTALANMWEVLGASPTTECMLRAIMRANRAMYDASLRTRILDMAVRETKEDRDVVEAAYKSLEAGKAWPQNEMVVRKNIEGTVQSLLDNKQIDKTVAYDQIVDLTLANRIVTQLGKKEFPY